MNAIKPIAKISALAILIFSFNSCEDVKEVNELEEKEKILELHNLQRKYHFEKMAEEFASLMSIEYISVNKGEIKKPTKGDNIKRFSDYFNSVEFEKWDDIKPPIIRFSDDYTVAYTIVNKEVVVKYLNENKEMTKQQTEFSWVTIYKKHIDGWKIDCVASTNKPSVTNIIDK
jgi:hypothetical protein